MTCASLISFLFLALFGFHSAYGMDCNLGQSKNVIDQFINSCPRPLIDSQDESYCCWTSVGDNMKMHCCDGWSFVLNRIPHIQEQYHHPLLLLHSKDSLGHPHHPPS